MDREKCVVGFAGESGIQHLVAVEADSVFEAATRALVRFQAEPWLKAELSMATVLVVEVVSSGRDYRVRIRRLLAWFDGGGRDLSHRYKLKMLPHRPSMSPRVNARVRAH